MGNPGYNSHSVGQKESSGSKFKGLSVVIPFIHFSTSTRLSSTLKHSRTLNFHAPLTGFEMMQIMASGQCWAQAAVRVATIVALVLNKSSRVIPENDPIQYCS